MGDSFKVGDRVIIREWDDMVSEFGINSYGSIKCRGSFVSGMRGLCGQEAVIRWMDDRRLKDGRVTYMIVLDSGSGKTLPWNFSTDMIEPICSYCQQTDLIDGFINSYDLLIS